MYLIDHLLHDSSSELLLDSLYCISSGASQVTANAYSIALIATREHSISLPLLQWHINYCSHKARLKAGDICSHRQADLHMELK